MTDTVSLQRLLFNLNTLAELGEEITSPKDFMRVLKSSLYMVMGSFSSSKGAIFRYEEEKGEFTCMVSKGIDGARGAGVGLPGDAVREFTRNPRPVDLEGADQGLKLLGASRDKLKRMGARYVSFLVSRDELLGFVAINEKFSQEEFTPYDFQLFSVMTQHLSVSLQSHFLLMRLMAKYNENKALFQNLRRIYYDTIHAFAAAIDAKDAYTKGHSHRVSAYSSAVATEMGWNEDETEGIRIAGLLHDIGKIAVDKTIINKATPLTHTECRELNSHPVIGYEILSKIKFPWKDIPLMTRGHHEKVDGSGYPDRLRSEKIPVGARIMALVDAFDAMTTDRPYRPRLSFREAMDEVRENLGRQFDPFVVRTFISVVRKELLGKSENPTVVPLLQEELDPVYVDRLYEALGSKPAL